MLHAIFSWLWGSALAQFGIAGLVLAGAVAVFIWIPLSPVRHLAVIVACVAIFFLIFAPRFYVMGINYEKAKWDAAEAAAVKKGDDARAAAEKAIPPVVDNEPAKAGPAVSTAAPPPPSGGLIQRVLHPARHPGVSGRDRYDRDHN